MTATVRRTFLILAATLIWSAVVLPVSAAEEAKCCKADIEDCGKADYKEKKLVALIIGVDSYSGDQEGRLKTLRTAANDAVLMAGTYDDHYRVRCLVNPTREQFLNELKLIRTHFRSLEEKHSANPSVLIETTVVVHFAGHGFRLNGGDFVIFRGDFASKQQAVDDGSLSVFWIGKELSWFKHTSVFIVIDACRNDEKLNWGQKGLGEPQIYPETPIYIVHSTGAGKTAHDQSDDIAGGKHGAFAWAVTPYFKLKNATLEWIYRTVGADAVLRRADQHPSFIPSGLPRPWPWSGKKVEVCAGLEQSALTFIGSCGANFPEDGGPYLSCAETNICGAIDLMLRIETLPRCTDKEINEVFPRVKRACDKLRQAASQVNADLPPQPTAVSPNLNFTLQRDALLAFSRIQRDIRQELPKGIVVPMQVPLPELPKLSSQDLGQRLWVLNDIAKKNNSLTAPNELVAKLRADLLLAELTSTREDLAPPNAAGWLEPPKGQLALYLLPDSVGGTTGVINPSGPAKVDCRIYCDSNWVMVAAPTTKGTVFGWLPAADVTPKRAIASITLRHEGSEVALSDAEAEKLEQFLVAAREVSDLTIKITAIASSADDQARIIAAGRAFVLKSTIFIRRPSRDLLDRISTVVVDGSSGQEPSRVLVELFREERHNGRVDYVR